MSAERESQRALTDVPAVCVAEDVNVGADVVFTVDTSGSMSSNDPSRLRVQAAKVFVQAMSARDRAGVVSFSSSAATRSNLRPLDTDAARAAVNSALDLTGAASGGTNISAAIARTISLLESSPAGRPRIGLLLTDGDGTYSRADAQAAADANVTIYTVGLGTGVNRGVLSEIAEVTGGEFIQLSAADQLVPLYEQLGDRIFDDGSDTDGDTITDCVETNGAFVPAVVTRAWAIPSSRWSVTTVTGTAVQTRADLADTDGDAVDDGAELREADLRDNPVLADVYSYLIDEGITRYYIEDSDPLDPLDPFADGELPDESDYYRNAWLSVDGLDVEQSTLFQPDRWDPQPVVTDRLLVDSSSDGLSIGRIVYDDAVAYDEGEHCVANCAAVDTLADQRNSDNGFLSPGCAVNPFEDDLECEEKQIVKDARSDQNVFGGDDHLSDYFVREQLALRCAIVIGDVDECTFRAFRTDFDKIEPSEIDALVAVLTGDASRALLQPGLISRVGTPLSGEEVPVRVSGGDAAAFTGYREALVVLFREFDRLAAAVGTGDGSMTRDQLYEQAPQVSSNSPETTQALLFLTAHQDRVEREGLFGPGEEGFFVTRDEVRDSMVRTEAFRTEQGLALEVLRAFPLVGKGESGTPIGTFSPPPGIARPEESPDNSEPSVQLLVETALLEGNPNDRVLQNEIIARMPETTSGLRNALITAMYDQYGTVIQDWLGPIEEKGANWALTAPWASRAVGRPIRGEIVLVPPSQCAADGNQWIFYNIGGRYAAFVELIQEHPNPTTAQWEEFFAANFDNGGDPADGQGDAVIRDGFAALIAAHYETDRDRAQQLSFQSNGLLATHEQEGVQGHLDCMDTLFPDLFEAWFVDLRIGDREISVTNSISDNFDGVDLGDPDSAPYEGNEIWGIPLFDLDPGLEDASTRFDGGGFDYRVGSGATTAVDVVPLDGITTLPIDWETWRANAGPGQTLYSGTAAGSWFDWEERMWFLINLFRVNHTNLSLDDLPAEDLLSGTNVWLGEAGKNLVAVGDSEGES